VTVWQAGERIDEGGEAPRSAVAVAQWWAAQSGLDVVHRTEHMHGGMGVDRSYPAHRFYLWARQLSGSLGGGHGALERIGGMLETLPQVVR
jgi:acyl-CoA dehydrogenase